MAQTTSEPARAGVASQAWASVPLSGGRALHLGLSTYELELPYPAWALETGRRFELKDQQGAGMGVWMPELKPVSVAEALDLAPNQSVRDSIIERSHALIHRVLGATTALQVPADHWYITKINDFALEVTAAERSLAGAAVAG